jgi:1-acyl-sn-glycerol-3-phosphate acyltransferase
MIRAIKSCHYALAYYMSWVFFMGGGLVLSVCSLPLLPWRGNTAVERRMRAVQRVLFRLMIFWFRISGVLRIRFNGFDSPAPPSPHASPAAPSCFAPSASPAPRAHHATGTVYISTHPTLIDAPLLLARLPDTIGVTKPGVINHPLIGAAAIMAGFVTGTDGVDMLRVVTEKIRAGSSLLIFPEGTRTERGAALNPFRPGYVLIASRAAAPVRLVIVRASAGLVTRGRPWWKLPDTLPASIDFTLDREWRPDPAKPAAALNAEIEARARACLRQGPA